MIKNNLITLHIKRKQLPIFYLFFFIFLLSSGNSRLYAEENRAFNFSTLNLNNGLSQLSVLDICQDDKGYIWFATRNGLNKYDGTHFTIYKHRTGITIPCQTIISPNYFRTTYAEGFGWVPITD